MATGSFRDDWENYTTFNPDPIVWCITLMVDQTVIEMQAWALRKFYLRPEPSKAVLELRTISPDAALWHTDGVVKKS